MIFMFRYLDKLRDLGERGLTLIETLVVVTIISSLLGIGGSVVWNVVKDSDVEDFISNATNVEEASHLFYRDEGFFPLKSEAKDITAMSKKVMINELNKLGVPDSEGIVDRLIDGGNLSTIDYVDLADYTRVRIGDKGTEGPNEFVIVDKVDKGDLSGIGSWYENELAGYVFSKDVVTNSSKDIYSGRYLLRKDEDGDGFGEVGDSSDLEDVTLKSSGIRVDRLEELVGSEIEIDLSWEDRWLRTGKNRLAKGFTLEEVDFKVDGGEGITVDLKKEGISWLATLKGVKLEDVLTFTLGGKPEQIRYNGEVAKEGQDWQVEDIELTLEVENYVSNPTDNDKDANEMYKEWEEIAVDEEDVIAVEEGLEIRGLGVGDMIVLKEVRNTVGGYDFDPNRTRLFEVNSLGEDGEFLIEKNPYLQKDFQTNVNSRYEYVLEFYKRVKGNKDYPEHAIRLYYD